MSHTITEPTFTGYISSTHDALIIFECVRRGIMPKISRRLRDDERKLIRSGSVFVFDERESGIKRWTDGLLWSPSRILWNFLVYRQIEKRSGKGTDASRQSSGTLNTPGELTIDPLAHGVSYNPGTSSGPSSVATSPAGGTFADMRDFANSRGRSVSSASDSAAGWRNTSYVDPRYSHQHSQLITSSLSPMTGGNFSAAVPSASGSTTMLMDRKEVDLERALVGSLKSSYPFAKDGLCKKTISIQVQGSTQHLISYYKVDDVRSGRLRTPVSLPELSSLNISPILLNKSNFRNPPDIEFLPDGSVRYRGDGSEASRRSTGTGSGSDGTSGSEGRSIHGSAYSSGVPLSPTSSDIFFPPIPNNITGYDSRLSGFQNTSGGFLPRRLSGTLNRSGRMTSGRYEPYGLPPSHGHRGDVALRSSNLSSEQIIPGAEASSPAWMNGHSALNRPFDGHAPSSNRQPWASQMNSTNDSQQYLRDSTASTGHWQARSDDAVLSNWSNHSGIVKADTGTEAGFSHRPAESPRYRESSDTWSQPQLPLLSGQPGQTLQEGHGNDHTSRITSQSASRPYGSASSEVVASSAADSFPALSSQILSDFSANRNSSSLMTAPEGHLNSVSNAKLHQVNHNHHAQQVPQQAQQQSLSAYSHSQPQNDWSESSQDPSQHHSYRAGAVAEQQQPDVTASHTMYSPGWSSYSAQAGLPQAEGVLDMRSTNHGDSLGSRSGLGAVLLTRPDSSQFRPTSSGSFAPHQ